MALNGQSVSSDPNRVQTSEREYRGKYSNVERELSDARTGITRFMLLNERPLDGYTWSGGDLRGNEQPQDLIMYGQRCGCICLMHQKRKQSKHGLPRNQSSKMQDNYVVSSSLNQMRLEGAGHKRHHDHITAKGMNSVIHCSLVHKFTPMPQALKIPDAKADKEWRESWHGI